MNLTMGLFEKYWGFGIVGGGGVGIKTIHNPITWKWYEVRSKVLPSESPACFLCWVWILCYKLRCARNSILFLLCKLNIIMRLQLGFPGGASSKEPACQCRKPKRCRLDPGSGRSPGGGDSNPLQYSWLENPMDRGAWWATVHGVTSSQMQLNWLSMHTCTWEPTVTLPILSGY